MKKIEIILRKLILQIMLLLQKSRIKKQPVLSKSPKILVIRLNRIGDALVTTPLLKIIKASLSAHITVLADRKNYFVFERCSGVDEIVILKKGTKEIKKLVSKLNKYEYDLVIDLHDDISTTVSYILSRLNSPNIIGLDKGKNISKLYTATAAKPDSTKFHVIDRNLKILELLNISYNPDDVNVDYIVTPDNLEHSSNFLENHFAENKCLLGVNISAGNEARFWGIDNFRNLISQIENDKYNIILLCSPGDEVTARKISDEGIPIYFTPKFEEFAGMISQLDILFTPDTSVVHLASSYKIPVFGIYVKFNTKDIIWYPYKSEYETIITEEETLKNVKFDDVINKFIPFLERVYNAKRNT